MPWQIQTQLHIPTKDVKAAFSALKNHPTLHQDHCFCYFIDDLDEYEETTQEDFKSVVEMLSDWILASAGSVKICVSSREYNVFLNGFSSERRLRLQDLTRADMELYVRDKLLSRRAPDFEDLIRAIVGKGDGIFLWVALVVKALRERIEDGHDPQIVIFELESLPRELELLLKTLLDSLSPSYKQKFYQLFAMMSKLQASCIQRCLSPLACSFLEDLDGDPSFAMKKDFLQFNMDEQNKRVRIDLTKKKINGYCKGLFEFRYYEGTFRSCLVNTHRSIPEFLATPNIRTEFASYVNKFDTAEAISQLLLAEIRCTSPKSVPRKSMAAAMYRIVALR